MDWIRMPDDAPYSDHGKEKVIKLQQKPLTNERNKPGYGTGSNAFSGIELRYVVR